MAITKQDLIDFGMIEMTSDERFIFPMKKVISVSDENEEDENEEDENNRLAICVTNLRNQTDFVLATPDGILYLGVKTIEDLQKFEEMILMWEPKF